MVQVPNGCGTFTDFTFTESPEKPKRKKPECLVVWENRNMSKQAANDGVEEQTPTPDATLQLEVPDGQPQDVEFVEDPGTEDEPDGYGHGV